MVTIKINIAKANIYYKKKKVKQMKEHLTSISKTRINNKDLDLDSSTLIKV